MIDLLDIVGAVAVGWLPWAAGILGLLLGPLVARFILALGEVLDRYESEMVGGCALCEAASRAVRDRALAPGLWWHVATSVVVGGVLAGGALLGSVWGLLGQVVCAAAFFLVAVGILLDLRSYWLPDIFTVPVMWIGLLAAAVRASPVSPEEAILGAAVFWMVLAAPTAVLSTLAGRRTMYDGDLRLAAGSGAVAGYVAVPSFMVGLGLGACVLWVAAKCRLVGGGGPKGDWVPAGPAIAVGSVAAALHGWDVINLAELVAGLIGG